MKETMKKYSFTGDTMYFEGTQLKRIYYVKDIPPYVKKGELGGWIESEDNLSHDGYCLALQNSKIFGNAKVIENAKIIEDSILKDNAILKGESLQTDGSVVGADTIVDGGVVILGSSIVHFFKTNPSNNPHISGSSIISYSAIEATGIILDTSVHKSNLTGAFNLIDADEIYLRNISY